jgi:hypothetical protein
MNFRALLLSSLTLFAAPAAFAEAVPEAPFALEHPGSLVYPNRGFTEERVPFNGRSGTLYLPTADKAADKAADRKAAEQKWPLLAFGHGYNSAEFTYRETFVHLARKGVAVAFVPYESEGPRDFNKMARDYNRFVSVVLKKYPKLFDPAHVAFSGHSDGASVAFLASAAPQQADANWVTPANIIAFAISKNIPAAYKSIPAHVPCTLVVGEDDTEDPASFSKSVYQTLECRKQTIVLRSYKDGFSEEVIADHGSIRNIGWWGSQTSALHYYGYWKFMFGAALDAADGGTGLNKWLFGPEAAETGSKRLQHIIIKP